MEVDQALSRLGTFGKWQFIHYTVLSFAVMFPTAFHMVAIVYIGYKPDNYRCKLGADAIINESIPYENGVLSSCNMYVDRSVNNQTVECTDGWVYPDYTGSSIATQWDLVCSRSYLGSLPQAILVWGVMLGAIFFTAISDYYGRKPVFLFSQWAMVVVGTTCAFTTNMYFFFFLRFLTGALQQGILLTGFVLACELFAAPYRTFAGIMIENFWAVAWCIFPLIAYLIEDWKYLQLSISLIGLFTIPLFWFLPESVPWLVANNKITQAENIIKNAAKLNKISMPDQFLTRPTGSDREAETNEAKVSLVEKIQFWKRGKKETKAVSTRYTIIDLLKNRRLTIYAVVMSFIWMVVTLVYYGLTLSTATLAGDRFVNAFLNAVVEIPAYTSSYFVLKRFGRRWPLVVYHIIAGVSLILTNFIPLRTANGTSLEPLIIILNMIGKFGITGSFGIVFLYAPEIFPTTLRNQALGIASLFGRLGNTMATFTSYVKELAPWLIGPLFGILSIGGGLLVLLLPETLNRPLPQTIEDIEAWDHTPPLDPYKKPASSVSEQELKTLSDAEKI